MSAYTEQEELEKLKAWWKNYGPALLIGVVIGVALLFGNKYWKEHKERQREEASGNNCEDEQGVKMVLNRERIGQHPAEHHPHAEGEVQRLRRHEGDAIADGDQTVDRARCNPAQRDLEEKVHPTL